MCIFSVGSWVVVEAYRALWAGRTAPCPALTCFKTLGGMARRTKHRPAGVCLAGVFSNGM